MSDRKPGANGEAAPGEGPEIPGTTADDDLPRDRGWAWMIVTASFMCNFLLVGGAKSMGVFFVEFQERFSAGSAMTSWILALHACLGMFLGPFSGALSVRFSSRRVVIVGGVLVAAGYVLSAVAPSLGFLYFSLGIISGIGFGLAYAPTMILVSIYFRKRRALANGISYAGSGVGNFTIPPLIRTLTDYFSLFGALLVMAGLMCHVVLVGCLLRPLTFYTRKKNIKPEPKEDKVSVERDSNPDKTEEQSVLLTSSSSSAAERNGESHSQNTFSQRTKQEIHGASSENCVFRLYQYLCFMPSPPGQPKRPLFDISLLRIWWMRMYLVANFLSSAGYPIAFIILPPYAKELGYTKTQGALLVSIIGISDLIGRIVLGFISDFNIISKVNMYTLTMFFSGVACIVAGAYKSYIYLATMVGIFGCLGGSFLSLNPVILAETLGEKRLPSSFGLCILVQGIAFLIAMPLAGMLKDSLGRWSVAFYISGGVIILGSAMMLLNKVAKRVDAHAHNKTEMEMEQLKQKTDV